MLTMANDLAGGWDISNIFSPQNVSFGSGFFPTPQRSSIESNITEAAGGTGETFRPTLPDALSVFETSQMAQRGWIGTPYQQQFSIPAKVIESKQLASIIESDTPPVIQGGLDSVLDIARSTKVLWDEIKDIFDKPREVITEKPRAGYPEGENVVHFNDLSVRSAQVVERFGIQANKIIDQVKGLFNVGYPQTQVQPVTNVTGDLSMANIPFELIAIVLIILFLVKK